MLAYTYHSDPRYVPSSSYATNSEVRPRHTAHRQDVSPVFYDQRSSLSPVGDDIGFHASLDPLLAEGHLIEMLFMDTQGRVLSIMPSQTTHPRPPSQVDGPSQLTQVNSSHPIDPVDVASTINPHQHIPSQAVS